MNIYNWLILGVSLHAALGILWIFGPSTKVTSKNIFIIIFDLFMSGPIIWGVYAYVYCALRIDEYKEKKNESIVAGTCVLCNHCGHYTQSGIPCSYCGKKYDKN